MGVPSLFRSVISKYPSCCYSKNEDTVEHLYLDFNCLIHHCNNNLTITPSMSPRDVEEELIISVISYTSHIITNVIKPTKLVFIAFDGPINMGKIHQQRNRRYKKVQDDAFIKKLNEKYNKPEVQKFNSNKITPGTVFMTKLCNRLKNLITLNAFSTHITNPTKKFSVFMSDSNTPGEGEHKIINFINNNNNSPNIVIYGLDADLIILSMYCHNKSIKLLREPQNSSIELVQCDPTAEFIYLDMNQFTTSFINEYKLEAYDKERVLNDFIFVSFFGGNDFVEPFINSRMRDNNNFLKLMNIYVTILFKNQNHFVNEDKNINYEFLLEFVNQLNLTEDVFVKKKALKQNSYSQQSENDYDNELLAYQHSFYTDEKNPFHQYYSNQYQQLNYKLPHTMWKKQYYLHFCEDSNINDICYDYIKSLIWTYKYYTSEGVPSYRYYYKYRVAPCASDLYNYLLNEKDIMSSITFEKDVPISPIEQLLIVTPIQHSNLLPWSYHQVLKEDVQEFYSIKFKLDVLKGLKNIYSDPILPDINFEYIDTIMATVPVSEIEATRNKIKDKIFYFKV